MRHRFLTLLAAGSMLFALAACGGGGDDGGATTTAPTTTTASTYTFTTTEFEFEPTTMSVPADTEVTITLVNDGVVEHDITIDELGFQLLARPGETVTASVTFPAGIHHVNCSIPGHHEAGMMAEIIAG